MFLFTKTLRRQNCDRSDCVIIIIKHSEHVLNHRSSILRIIFCHILPTLFCFVSAAKSICSFIVIFINLFHKFRFAAFVAASKSVAFFHLMMIDSFCSLIFISSLARISFFGKYISHVYIGVLKTIACM